MPEPDNLKSTRKLLEDFAGIFVRFQQLEKVPRRFGTEDQLYPAEIHTIAFIGEQPGTSALSIGQYMNITKGAVSQMVKKLIQKNFIRRETNPDNRTQSCLYLTEKGRTAFESHEKMHEKIIERISAYIGPISEDTYNTVKTITRKIIRDLDNALDSDSTYFNTKH